MPNMPHPTTYEIVIRGRASARLLRPLLDDFTFDRRREGTTRLVGEVTDAAHMHGLHAHLASVHAEVISIAPLATSPTHHIPAGQLTHQPRSTQP